MQTKHIDLEPLTDRGCELKIRDWRLPKEDSERSVKVRILTFQQVMAVKRKHLQSTEITDRRNSIKLMARVSGRKK